ncbi:hypothetical protein [Maricaulis parjimensis]|uniref:hypothetical protein n=1 Tax=Maricaulis parjimensis TaxID=144023 RepID=UPI001939C7A9|nr:hypothetical protein [Maricaulis parjimensis]
MATHTDRRNIRSQTLQFSITETALVWRTETGEWGGDMPLDQIRRVRLAVEMAGQSSQVVCRVTDAEGQEAVFGSMQWTGPGAWTSTADTFRPFLTALHTALAPHDDQVDYLEGPSLTFTIIMFALGLILAAISVAGLIIIAGFQENPIGLALIGGIGAGAWLMWVFLPKPPARYNPGIYRAEPEAG